MRGCHQCICRARVRLNVILHLGLGAFHRAHQAVYLHRLRKSGDSNWRLVAGNIRNDAPEVLARLQAAHGRYSLETIAPDGDRQRELIESIDEVVSWQDDLERFIAIGALADTRIISFTVTEAGYYLDAADRLTGDDIANDALRARNGAAGSTVYGALHAILRARRTAGAGGVTLLSCDNLRRNGARFRSGLLQFIELTGDGSLLDWVRSNVRCPSSMVDRITPRPDADADPLMLVSERYIQWVIEDDFAAGRPNWESVGVQMVDSVAPYEEAKIRILNGSHSGLAWGGSLLGYSHVHESARDPRLWQLALDYVADVIPCLTIDRRTSASELHAYRDIVLTRFRNDSIRDTNQRVALDSASKFAGFIAPTIRDRLDVRADISNVAALPALLLRFLQRWQRGELPYRHRDQSMNESEARAICTAADPVAALCGQRALFGDAAGDRRLIAAVLEADSRVAHVLGI